MRVNIRTMAKEKMEQTKNSILSQASQAMLAQANRLPQGVPYYYVNRTISRGIRVNPSTSCIVRQLLCSLF